MEQKYLCEKAHYSMSCKGCYHTKPHFRTGSCNKECTEHGWPRCKPVPTELFDAKDFEI